MAKIIGEPDSIETIRHYLLSHGITNIDTLDDMRVFIHTIDLMNGILI